MPDAAHVVALWALLLCVTSLLEVRPASGGLVSTMPRSDSDIPLRWRPHIRDLPHSVRRGIQAKSLQSAQTGARQSAQASAPRSVTRTGRLRLDGARATGYGQHEYAPSYHLGTFGRYPAALQDLKAIALKTLLVSSLAIPTIGLAFLLGRDSRPANRHSGYIGNYTGGQVGGYNVGGDNVGSNPPPDITIDVTDSSQVTNTNNDEDVLTNTDSTMVINNPTNTVDVTNSDSGSATRGVVSPP